MTHSLYSEKPVTTARSLLGRQRERAALSQLLSDVRSGRGRAVVLRGEPSIGKTALLDDLCARADGVVLARVAGVESEMELVFAALQQLCAPMLDKLAGLPDPQRAALGVAFGLTTGTAPDRFLVGLAALSLLSEVAEQQPLLCVVDDAQWLDRASALVLAFVARRLLAEPVALVFATREPGEEFRGLPELLVGGLGEGDARELLSSVIRGPLGERVRASRRGAASGPDRGELRAAAGGSAGSDPSASVAGGCRPVRRCVAGVAGGRAAGHPGSGGGVGGRSGAGGVRLPGAVPASAGTLGGLPVGVLPGKARGALDPGGGHRPPS